ncbi:MAG TPA: hypothetical protein VGN57_19555 [Pirellulaceae bacterium]|jgi:PBP1b-binding outer membrane lipoprotein LpoB|nr:hypothetical protein [Pirellulaceae bacterium]
MNRFRIVASLLTLALVLVLSGCSDAPADVQAPEVTPPPENAGR